MPNTFCFARDTARSRIVAKSGIRPTYQNTTDTVAYVDTAKTSQISGLRNCGHNPIVLGYGNSQYAASHGRPVWKIGKIAAHITAKIVIASAKRLIDMRHCCLNSSRIAEMRVPAWPIPIHQTKLMMSKAHATGMLLPQMPMPRRSSHESEVVRPIRSVKPI